ncbi:MAG: VapC toxin family PIN domain ribonuclease [Longimicrobiales bacterium]|nr:VapC toxin family PIN domain ribonuclease [Longimicrobiales bacterium]
MTALLDVNVLVALAWPNHIHHARAHAWFAWARERGWATTPVTQSGFVLVSSNTAAVPDSRTPREAMALLRRIVELPGHVFWPDDAAVADEENETFARVVGYRQVTDAHLLSLAIRRGGRLATFDAGIRDLVPEGRDPSAVVEMVP